MPSRLQQPPLLPPPSALTCPSPFSLRHHATTIALDTVPPVVSISLVIVRRSPSRARTAPIAKFTRFFAFAASGSGFFTKV